MRIAVSGAGSVGGYFGGRLSKAGEDVVFTARGDHLAAMRTGGLRVDSINGDFNLQPVQATDAPSEIGTVDLVLLGVKARQVPRAAEAMQPMIGPETFVLPLQNGLEAPGQLSEILGGRHVLCGLFCYLAAPGHIVHAAMEPFIMFGEPDNRRSQRTDRLLDTFERAGIRAEIPPDIDTAMWNEFFVDCRLERHGRNYAVADRRTAESAEMRRMAAAALREIVAVAEARGADLPGDALQTTMGVYDSLAHRATASLQRDVMAGRPSELDAQMGAVVRFGRESEVATPLHRAIYNSLLPWS